MLIEEGGDFSRHDPFTISLWVKVPKEYERAVDLPPHTRFD